MNATLRIDYYQNIRGRVLRLAWRTPSQQRALAEQERRLDLNPFRRHPSYLYTRER